jgi:hypothetical protein
LASRFEDFIHIGNSKRGQRAVLQAARLAGSAEIGRHFAVMLKRDEMRPHRHRALGLQSSTIFSEDRFALFRIMLQNVGRTLSNFQWGAQGSSK